MLNHNARASSPFTFGPHFPLILLIGLGGACLANAFTFMSMKYVIGVCVGLFCVCVLIYFHHYVTQISLFALVSASGMWFQFWILNQKNPRYIYHLGGAQPEPMISLVLFWDWRYIVSLSGVSLYPHGPAWIRVYFCF